MHHVTCGAGIFFGDLGKVCGSGQAGSKQLQKQGAAAKARSSCKSKEQLQKQGAAANAKSSCRKSKEQLQQQCQAGPLQQEQQQQQHYCWLRDEYKLFCGVRFIGLQCHGKCRDAGCTALPLCSAEKELIVSHTRHNSLQEVGVVESELHLVSGQLLLLQCA